MIYQPTLKKLEPASRDIEYKLRYYSLFLSPDDSRIESSHIHDCYEIYVNISGDVKFLINNRVYPVQRGDMVLTRPNDMHVCILNSPSLHEHYCLYFNCSEDSPILDFFKSDSFTPVVSMSPEYKKKLIDALGSMCVADENGRVISCAAYFFSLFAFLNESENNTYMHDSKTAKLPDELQKILDYINANFTEIKYIESVVSDSYVSATTLNRWFKKYIHLTPREYLEMKKLAYAKILLDEGTSVTDACMESGFSDCSHFISVFKKKFGKTPNKYKNE